MKPIDYIRQIKNQKLCPHCWPNFYVENKTSVICGVGDISIPLNVGIEPCAYDDWLKCPLNKEEK